jgi:hypothetical protein
MININILKEGHRHNQFDPQTDITKFSPSEYCLKENSDEDLVWDYVVVYENFDEHPEIKCRPGGLVFVAGEPPLMRPYPKEFLNQFDIVIVPNKKIKHRCHIQSHGFLPWSLGLGHFSKKHRYSYSDYEKMFPKKEKAVSIVTSSKKMMPGHVKRMKLIELLKRDFPDSIDYYGFGSNTVDYKADALLPYYFHICMENCSVDDYWTEKFSDPVLALSVPIYSGCPNISDYFKGGYVEFDVNDYVSLHKFLQKVIDNPEGEYNKYKQGLIETRKVLMEKENLIPFILSMAKENNVRGEDYVLIRLKHPQECKLYGLMNLQIRMKRLFKRLIINWGVNGK